MSQSFRNLLFAGLILTTAMGVAWTQTKPSAGKRLANSGDMNSKADALKSGFDNPPASARPRVWWHWMDGNISKTGIQLDLQWMHRVGIAGFQNFDAALTTPKVVEKRLPYMTPEWKDAFKYATVLADQLGMEEAIAGSPGWSESGGPWVPAAQGMKKYVWSETEIEGGKPFTGKLAHPPSNTGAFQNIGIHDQIDDPNSAVQTPQFYADSVVIGYKAASTDVAVSSLRPRITANAGSPNFAMLDDGDLVNSTPIPIPAAGGSSWIQYEFPTPQTIRSVSFVIKELDWITAMFTGIAPPIKTLEASDDGNIYRLIAKLEGGNAPQHTVSFPPVTAKFFRVTFKKGLTPRMHDWAVGQEAPKVVQPTNYDIAELVLHPGARVNRFEEKAAFTPEMNLYSFATSPVGASDAIAKSDIVDLTSKMAADGTLDWTPPAGKWVVLRFGYSLLGITNHPATREATGLEVDKLDRGFVKQYMENYLNSYQQAVGPELMGKRGIRYVISDSWEAGSQNWTDKMIAQFKQRRGYDPLPWMPVLTGRIVESAEASDRFLWDFRKTISDLIADEHYGQLEATLHEYNMGHYGESHEAGRAFVADGMEVKKFNEIPMSAMWTQRPGVNEETNGFNADDRESASVAHIYGQNLAAAESMTASAAAPWAWSPATLKPTADQEFLNGINRFVIHESAHQPLVDMAPGLTLGPYGQWFNRNETWAEQAGPWIDYLSRTSYLLQQGRFNADIVYFYGEDSNLTAVFYDKAPNIPAGFNFDYINADALIHMVHTSAGRITTASGMSYRVLALDPNSTHMSLPVLRAIHKLVQEGAVVVGVKPTDDPSLADNPAEFRKLNDELFGDGSGARTFGKGTVYAGQSLQNALTALKVTPDFDTSKPANETKLRFVHRKLSDGDLYFVDNRKDSAESLDASFRVSGKVPELWHAETGLSEPVSYTIADGRTRVPLNLEPWGTVFIVFRKAAHQTSLTLPSKTRTTLITAAGPWNVSFQPKRGAPASITLDKLTSWSDHTDAGVKYFSGTGTYTKTLQAQADWFNNSARLWIDLGDVKNLAEVIVNGKSLGIVWHAPYRVDATTALKPGENDVTIKVTNAWVNRLIGDEQPNATKVAFTDVKPYNASSPLQDSGLIGPVIVYSLSE